MTDLADPEIDDSQSADGETGDDEETTEREFPFPLRTVFILSEFGLISMAAFGIWYFTDSFLMALVGGLVLGVIASAVIFYFLTKYAAEQLNDALPVDILNVED